MATKIKIIIIMKYIFTLISLIAFASCATTNYLTIEIKEAASVTFPNDVKNVLIVDNGASQKVGEGDASSPAILSNDSAKAIMLNSLKKFMNEEKYFDRVELYSKKTNSSDSLGEIRLLSPSKVRALIRENKADALISLDIYIVSAEIESASIYYFNDYKTLCTRAGGILRIYGANGSMIIRPVVFLDSLFREGGEDWSRRKTKINELNELISEISVKTADNLTGAFI
ncbi:MAG: DUF6340 family protein, partial [Prevotella sp.]|nr:DUF6340 family protein [Prevotella sp.]